MINSVEGEEQKENSNNDSKIIETPSLSITSNEEWWNGSFSYRKIINITNPLDYDLDDFVASIEFNYTQLTDASPKKMQDDLDDIRIVENGVLRQYYYKIDCPQTDFVTVWFAVDVSADSTDYDTYLYYGNDTVGKAEGYFNSKFEHSPYGFSHYSFEGDTTDTFDNHDATEVGYWDPLDYNQPGIIGDCVTFLGDTASHWTRGNGVQLLTYNDAELYEDNFSISFWFKSESDSGDSEQARIITRDHNDYYALCINQYEGDPQDFIFYYSQVQSQTWPSGGTPHIEVNYWYHVVMTWDTVKAHVKLWINGIEWLDSPDFLGFDDENRPLTLGGRVNGQGYHGGYPFTGKIDEVRLYDYSLSDQEIVNLYNHNFILTTELNEEQSQFAEVKVICYDVDGRIVPNAEVSLINSSGKYKNNPYVFNTSYTDDNGEVIFRNVDFGTYNFTVKYNDTSTGMEYLAYNSTDENWGTTDDDIYTFTELNEYVDLHVDLWTIDFEIDDWDGDPFNYAYINVSDNPEGTVIDTLYLDEDGLETFIWDNRSHYYYEVFYNNSDYSPNPTALNASYINRTVYNTDDQKYFDYMILANETMTFYPATNKYIIEFDVFTDGNSSFNYNKLIGANITLTNMVDKIDHVKIYYIDKENQSLTNDHLIYDNQSYSGGTEDFKTFNIRTPPSTPNGLIQDNYEAYGLHLYIEGTNSTQNCNGIIKINTTEACHIFNRTDFSKIKINVIDNTLNDSVSQVIIHVLNNTTPLVDLITDESGDAYCITNNDAEFWYKRGNTYNYTIEYFGTPKQFNITYADPVLLAPTDYDWNQTYTLDEQSILIFQIIIDPTLFATEFTSFSGSSSAVWGQNLIFDVTFESTDDGGVDWDPITDPDYLRATVQSQDTNDIVLTRQLSDFVDLGSGQFRLTIDSSKFSAGNASKFYLITIYGSKQGYSLPPPETSGFSVNTIPTSISIHNYNNLSQVLTEISQYYEESIKIPIKYFITSSNNSIPGAALSYAWQFGSGSIPTDPSNPDYYTFEIDTTDATNIGKYRIDVTAYYENHSMIINYPIDITILARPTTINETTDLLQISPKLWVLEERNFTFEYRDTRGNKSISDIETASYTWFRLDDQGTPLSGSNNEGLGDLIKTNKSLYILDFDTETREVGEYSLFVSLQKNNYEIRHSYITLTIRKRLINTSLSIFGLSGNKITIDQGNEISFNITLTDPTNLDQSLTGATVTLTTRGNDYILTEIGNGTYVYSLSTSNIDTFFMPSSFGATITIEKENYESERIELIIEVGMTEIFSGFPMFYFLMILISVIAVVGSLATYRIVQQRRIPIFIKKARSMKKSIKGNKTISDSLLYPSKEEVMVKKLGDKWDSIGLSLEDIMGIKEKKKMELPEAKEEIKGGVD